MALEAILEIKKRKKRNPTCNAEKSGIWSRVGKTKNTFSRPLSRPQGGLSLRRAAEKDPSSLRKEAKLKIETTFGKKRKT